MGNSICLRVYIWVICPTQYWWLTWTSGELNELTVPAEAVACTLPGGSSSYASPWLWHCRTWWSTGNTADFHAGLERGGRQEEIREREIMQSYKVHLFKKLRSTLTGLNRGCRRSVQSDGFVRLCWLFRGSFWRWIRQSPSHHYLLYVQNPRVHPGVLEGFLLALTTTFFFCIKTKETEQGYKPSGAADLVDSGKTTLL